MAIASIEDQVIETKRAKRLARDVLARFDALSRDEQEMETWRMRIDWVCTKLLIEQRGAQLAHTREAVAAVLLQDRVNSAYAERMLADPEFRKIVGLPALD